MTVTLGEASTLTWETENAESVTLDNGIGEVELNGTVEIVPIETTTYTLTAIGPGGTTTAQVMVTVTHLPPSVQLSASEETIVVGQSAVLSWSSDFSQTCSIEPDIGVVDLDGSVTVSPTQTTTYKIIATGEGGEATDEVTITVTDPAPTVELTSTAATIILGESATLSWESTFASSCTIEPGIGTVAPSGSVEITPSETTTYTITAAGTGGTTTDQVTIAVQDPVPSVAFSASPSAVLIGQKSTLSWTSTYADTVEIDHGIGSVDINGNHDIFPSQTTTYTLTATGAGGSSTAEVTVTVTYPAPATNLTISADTITLGETTTLTWTSSNAVAVVIDNGIGTVAATGSMSVSPAATTTYTLTATGIDGTTASDSVTVTVNTPAPVVSFSADPATILDGESATLNWSTTYADSVNIDNGIGTVAADGSASVSPSATTTYTLTATGAGGTTTAQVTVTVTYPPPTADLQVSPDTILIGESATMSWSTTNAVTVVIDNGIGTVAANDSISVSPTATTTYTLTATGIDGTTASDSVIVTVNTPAPVVSLSADPVTILDGESSTLSWNTTYADTVSIDNGVGTVAAGGSVSVSPSATTTYTLTATGVGGTTTAQVTVTVTYPPPTADLQVTPDTILIGESATLNWSTTNAVSVVVDNGIGTVAANDSISVSPTATTTYTLTATGVDGTTATDSVIVTVNTPAPVVNFSADPGTILDGESSTLSWSTTYADTVSIDNGVGTAAADGSASVTPSATTTYTLTATGAGGTTTAQVTITVTYPPPTADLQVSPDTILIGESATLSWITTNAVTVMIDNGIGAVAANDSISVSPTATTTYTLTATGIDGTTASDSVIVTVNTPAPVVSLSADPVTIIDGESSTLSWNTTYADTVSIDNGVGTVAAGGSASVSPSATTTYTLTATGVGGTTTAQVTVTVTYPPPTADLQVTPDTILIGESATLSWSTANAVSVVIDNGIGTVAANDSISVSPTATTTYTLTATGVDGTIASDSVIVTVNTPAPVVSLSADPVTILDGESSTLNWSTTYADTVSIDNGVGTVAADGSASVSPSASTTYTLTATGAGGTTTAQVTITITYPPPTADLQVTPDTILTGESTTLSWSTTNAVSVVIDNGIGTVAANDSISVSPTATTTYILTATGIEGTTATDSVIVTVNTPEPVVNFSADPGTILDGESSTLNWSTTYADSVSIDNGVGTVAADGSASVTPSATTTYTLTATGAGGTTTAQVTVTVEPASGDIQVTFEATPSTVALGGSSTLTWSSQGAENAFIDNGVGNVSTDGSLTLSPEHTTTYTITVTGPTGSVSAQAVVTVTGNPEPLPTGSFGDTYQDLVPPDATIEAYDPSRFSLITGLVLDFDDAPIENINVTILHHPEYGTAKTDSDGRFSLPADGGGIVTVVYKKAGLITSHRKVDVPWNDYAVVETVQMLAEDPNETTHTFDGNPNTVSVHQSTEFTDSFGTRSATVVFQGDNSAYLVDANGNDVHALPAITTRATQYLSPESMPAVLPPTSGYTYCVELSVDGVERVRFEKPVIVWVENFLGFGVGTIVPVGYYDRDKGSWIPSDNGAVVELLDTDSDGVVDSLDADGDGSPDDLDQDADFADEVVGLDAAAGVAPGTTYTRFFVKHFSPHDPNFPVIPSYILPANAVQANPEGRPTVDNKCPDDEDCPKKTSSYVNQNSRVYHEDIFVPGTDIALHYSGDRVDDYITEFTVPASGATVPESLEGIFIELEVAGNTFKQTLPPEPYQMAQFQWDGYDYLGRPVHGPIKAYVKIGFEYQMEYATPAPDGSPAFGRTGIISTGIPAQRFSTVWKGFPLSVRRGSGTIAEGWTVSSHHRAYAKDLTKLFKGDGKLQIQDGNLISTITGGDCGLCLDPPEFENTGIAAITQILHPYDVAVDAAGSAYIAARDSVLVLRVDRDGSIRLVAGGGIMAGEIEDIPAIETFLTGPVRVDVDQAGNVYFIDGDYGTIYKVDTLGTIHIVLSVNDGYSPTDIALDAEGNLYFSNAWPGRVYKIDSNGTITPVAGADTYDYEDDYGEGGLALDAKFGEPFDISLDSDGNLYIAANTIRRILKVDIGGIISTYAGNGVPEYSGDGGAAVDASLFSAEGLAFDRFDNLYFSDWSHQRIRRINKDGIITTIIGTGDAGYFGDGGLPVKAHLHSPAGVAVAPDGSIYIADFHNHAVRRVSTPINYDNAQADSEVVFVDDDLQGHVISYTGQHDRTIDMQTGVELKSFAYDSEQRLTAITDQFGNQTTVERLSDGTPTAILSPDGIRTELIIDGNNHLVSVRYPDNGAYRFEYTPGGLITKNIEPEDNAFDYVHDAIGRVSDAYDQEGGHWTFSWTTNPNGEIRTEVTSAEGDLTSFVNHTDANGMRTATSTDPTGAQIIVTKSEDGMTADKSLPAGMQLGFEYGIDSQYQYKYLSKKTQTSPAGLEKTIQINKAYQDTDTDGIADLITKTIEVNNKSITIANDILSSEKVVTSPEGRTVTVDYDPSNLLTLNTSIPGLTPTGFGYDPRGRLTSVATGTRQTIYAYNDQGFVDSITDPENNTTSYSYDAIGRVTGIDRPDGGNIGFTYDANGNMTILTNPANVDHEFTYNTANLKDGNLTPISGNYSYVYDRDRRLIQTLFPSGQQINNAYTNSQLTQIQTPEGDIDITYDFGGNIDTVSAHGESLAYTYDGNLLTTATYSGTLNQTLSYTHNDDFDVISFDYAGGTQSYSYDLDGLLTGAGGYTITRNAQNGLPEAVSGTGLNIDRTFTGYGELASQSVSVNSQPVVVWTLSRDDNGRIIAKSETADGQTNTYDYTYDDVGRLLTVSKDGSLVEAYGYDPVGTRILETNTLRGITDRSLSYSDEDHLLAAGDAIYSYDLDGFLSTKTEPGQVTTYAYSSRGELQEAQLPDGRIITYDHDPIGRRIAKRVDGAIVEKYLWQGRTRLLAVYDGADNLIQRFEYADGRMPVAMTMAGVTYALGYDQVGSLRIVADGAGNVVKRIDYDTFGNIIADTYSSLTVPFGFAGGLHDRDTGLVRFGHRDFDPDTGRWTAKDPIGFEGGDTDLYGYVQNNPVSLIDPDGKFAISGTVAIGYAFFKAVAFVGSAMIAADLIAEAIDDAEDGAKEDDCPKRGVGGKGWRGDKKWRDQIRDVESGGDVDIDPTPNVDEAKDLIDAAGGSVDRIDSDGHAPGGVSNHTYPHINYTTPNGNKGTIRIK